MKMRQWITLTAALALAGSASAAPLTTVDSTIAGFDFSAFQGGGGNLIDSNAEAGAFTSDGKTLANYSDFDPSFGAGLESNPYGTLYYDGTNGSTAVPLFFGTDLLSVNPSLTSNLSTPGDNNVPAGDVAFGAANGVLNQDLGANDLALQARAVLNLVFEGSVSSIDVNQQAENWRIQLAGRTVGTGTAAVEVRFSTDGASFGPLLTTFSLNNVDTLFSASVVGEGSDAGFFQLRFTDATAVNLATIDNVTLHGDLSAAVPEPGTLVLVGTGLLGLARGSRRRA